MSEPDYYLVRVSKELLDTLVKDESEPVVVVGINANDDGTHNMWLRTVEAKS